MTGPAAFLTALAQALSTMLLYQAGHPARERAVDRAFERLREAAAAGRVEFSFLGDEVVHGTAPLHELAGWEWASRLSAAGVQRLEFDAHVTRADFSDFLSQVLARLSLVAAESAVPASARPSGVRFGAVGVRGARELEVVDAAAAAGALWVLDAEVETVQWMHEEVATHGTLPLLEADAVVRSLAVAMHADQEFVLPLLRLREFDEYTTTHSLNVSVLTMALAEHLGLAASDVRTFGVAGLLHDLGKVRVPEEILNKAGKLSDEERAIMQRHPVDGARLIIASDRRLDLAAAVAYEHHIMIDGGGYPCCQVHRHCHPASVLVHVCDVYDALRTRRPYRDAWEAERVLGYIDERAGTEFDATVARAFVGMMRKLEGCVREAPIPAALRAC